MKKTVGVCGFGSSGSSAVVDLLQEFNETQIFYPEFKIAYARYGLEYLERCFLIGIGNKSAIEIFKKTIKEKNLFISKHFNASKLNIDEALENFSKELVSSSSILDSIPFTAVECAEKITRKFFLDAHTKLNPHSPKFEGAAKKLISDILTTIGIDYEDNERNVLVLNQSVQAQKNIDNSFRFFENPVAIFVDRDPRDIYLFAKNFLHPRGMCFIPCDNVDKFIKYFINLRKSVKDLRKRNDVLFIKFEELVYDCDNAAKKISDFINISQRSHKGEFFKPACSRNNTQLSKKYAEYDADIKKIETELPEYIFPFENYPDIKSEGEMFYGGQSEYLQGNWSEVSTRSMTAKFESIMNKNKRRL